MQEDELRKLVRAVVQQVLGSSPQSSPPAPRRYEFAGRALITGADLEHVEVGGEIVLSDAAVLTPMAQELVTARLLHVVSEDAITPAQPHGMSSPPPPERSVALGADHGGLAMKQDLKRFLLELGYAVFDVGTYDAEAVDYPDFAHSVARLVAAGTARLGIVVDGAGIGSCMAANKVPGVRAAMCYDLATAANSREHNDANVLTLGGRMIDADLARQIVKTWLSTEFGGGRHARRVDKIKALEQRYLRR